MFYVLVYRRSERTKSITRHTTCWPRDRLSDFWDTLAAGQGLQGTDLQTRLSHAGKMCMRQTSAREALFSVRCNPLQIASGECSWASLAILSRSLHTLDTRTAIRRKTPWKALCSRGTKFLAEETEEVEKCFCRHHTFSTVGTRPGVGTSSPRWHCKEPLVAHTAYHKTRTVPNACSRLFWTSNSLKTKHHNGTRWQAHSMLSLMWTVLDILTYTWL